MAGSLLLLGAFFVLVSAIGILRFPDLYMRMHGATKAGTLGAGLILLGASVLFGTLSVTVKAMAVFVFLLLTAPVAAHVLGRAAHHANVPKWERTGIDELEGRYERTDPDHDGPSGMPAKG